MSMDLDRELLKALDVEASSERVQDLALQAVQKAANESLKEGLVTTSVEKTASAETGARIGGALGFSGGAALGAGIGAEKGNKLRSALLALAGGIGGESLGYVGDELATQKLSPALRVFEPLTRTGSALGAGEAVRLFGKSKKHMPAPGPELKSGLKSLDLKSLDLKKLTRNKALMAALVGAGAVGIGAAAMKKKEKKASAETGAMIGGALGLSPGAALGAAIGADKGDKLRSALLAGGGGLLGGVAGQLPGRVVGNVLETKSLSSRRMRNALLAARLAQVLGAAGGSSMGAGAAIKSFGKKKKASAGAGAVLGSTLLGTPGAALGAYLGKTPAEMRRRDPEKASPEIRAAVGNFLGGLGGGALGAGAGAGLGAGIGAMLPVAQQRHFKDALSELVGSGKPLSPRAAAVLASAGLGAGVGLSLGAPLGGALGAYKGAKGAFKRKEAAFADGEVVLRALNAARHAKTTKTMKKEKKKGKEKKASVLLYGLRHASDAGYENYMHKTAFIGQAFKQVGRGARKMSDAFFGGPPVRGAVGGGLAGGAAGAGSFMYDINKFRQAAKAGVSTPEALAKKALGSQYDALDDAAKSKFKDMAQRVMRVEGNVGSGASALDTLKAYGKEFGAETLGRGLAGAGVGALGGAAAQTGLRAARRSGLKQMAGGMVPVAAAGLGGLGLGYALS